MNKSFMAIDCYNYMHDVKGDHHLKSIIYESMVSLVSRRYMRVVSGREHLVVCLSEYPRVKVKVEASGLPSTPFHRGGSSVSVVIKF